MKNIRPLLAIWLLSLLCAATAYAQVYDRREPSAPAGERQDPRVIHRAVEQYLRAQTAGLPGAVTFTVGAIDARSVLPACAALDIYTPPGARLWGLTSVGVRCSGAAPWNIYVSAQVKVVGDYAVAARPLAQGQVLAPTDIATQSGDLTQLPAGVVTDPQQALGKTSIAAVAPGQPLRQDLLRAPLVIQQGQTVVVHSSGHGFRVSADGKALNNAYDGQIAQVRTASGQTLSGVARAGGIVEIRF